MSNLLPNLKPIKNLYSFIILKMYSSINLIFLTIFEVNLKNNRLRDYIQFSQNGSQN